ncbi:MAG: FtsK/SpoIIIE domain-containing protein, partial [Anaerolineae bacterium]
VVIRIDPISVPHLLIAGEPGAGKSALMRTIAISLALNNRQSQFQLMVLALESEESRRDHMTLEPLVYLPHMLTAVCHRHEEIVESLAFLTAEMQYRQEQQNPQPLILVLIDHVAEMLEMGGEPVSVPLQQLLQRGPDVGIHLVLSTSRPHAASLDSLMKANCPMRIVGRLLDGAASRAAAGTDSVRADYLLGAGEFLVVASGPQTFFQAAFLGDFDQHLCLQLLHRQRSRALLAYPIKVNGSSHTTKTKRPELDSQPFTLDEHVVELGQDTSEPLVLDGDMPPSEYDDGLEEYES